MKLNWNCLILGLLIIGSCFGICTIIVNGIIEMKENNSQNTNINIVHESQQFTKQIKAKYSGVVIDYNDDMKIHDIKVTIDGQVYTVPYVYSMLPKDTVLGDTVDIIITYHIIYIIRIDSRIIAATIDSVEMVQ